MTALVIVIPSLMLIPSLMGNPMGESQVEVQECFRFGARLCLAHVGARQRRTWDSAGRLRASMGVRRQGRTRDDRLSLASLGRV